MEITDQSFNIVDIKPANMEELTEVITASEFHPKECNHFVYSSSKGTIRLCDMRQAALCDTHAKRKCCSIYSADTVGHNSSGQKKTREMKRFNLTDIFKSYFPVYTKSLKLFWKEKPFEDIYIDIVLFKLSDIAYIDM